MLFFLYLSGIAAVLIGLRLFHIQSGKVSQKRLSGKESANYYAKAMIVDIVVMCLCVILGGITTPFLIWSFGPKEYGTVERIIETKSLGQIPQNNTDKYIKKIISKNSKNILINTGTKGEPIIEAINLNATEITKSESGKAQYQKVAEYKMKKLKGNNFISNAVNDIYANGYIAYDQGIFIKNKIKLTIP